MPIPRCAQSRERPPWVLNRTRSSAPADKVTRALPPSAFGPILSPQSNRHSAQPPAPHVPPVPSLEAFGRRPSARRSVDEGGRHPKPFTRAVRLDLSKCLPLILSIADIVVSARVFRLHDSRFDVHDATRRLEHRSERPDWKGGRTRKADAICSFAGRL